jgi:hypothetical protein
MSKIVMLPAAALLLGLAACDPYNPADRGLGGASIGAGTGAAVGAATGAGLGAATGVLTTPAPPPPRY